MDTARDKAARGRNGCAGHGATIAPLARAVAVRSFFRAGKASGTLAFKHTTSLGYIP